MLPIIPIIFLVRALSGGGINLRTGQRGVQTTVYSTTWRSALWGTLFLYWVLHTGILLTSTLEFVNHHHHEIRFDFLLSATLMWSVTLLGIPYLFFAWPLVRYLARHGGRRRFKLVYYLAQFALIFPRSSETQAAASLLALLALAHRGDATKEERDWVQRRIAKTKRHLGAYATACALHQMLEARASRDAGDSNVARDFSERARTLLGTTTYLSERGIPRGVKRVAIELLSLDDARNGRWGFVDQVPQNELTPVTRAIKAWQDEWFRKKPHDRKAERDRLRLGSTELEGLFQRARENVSPTSPEKAWRHCRRTFLALIRNEPVGPRAIINMLVVFDQLLHPENPQTILPESVRSNEALVASIQDQIAEAIADRLIGVGAPLHVMKVYGPISARVFQRVESALFALMDRSLAALDERFRTNAPRLDPFSEWTTVSHVRAVYRRLELYLGAAAVAQVYPRFIFRYCKLGVQLSEVYPRMRPLAHAVFKCLSGEAVRFQDVQNIKQQTHNMLVTRGVD